MRSTFLMGVLLLLAACGGQRGKVRIRGEFDNLPQADLLLYSPDGGIGTIVDTLHIKKGKFDYRTAVDGEQHTYVIIYPNYMTLSFQAHSGADVKIKGDAFSLAQVKVEGADAVLKEERGKSSDPVAIGKKLPKSKIVKHDGKHYLLLGFWADWKYGSNEIVGNAIRTTLREYSDSVRAFSYSLNLESKARNTISFTEDSTLCQTYCDHKGWKGELLVKYGIRNIPQMILVNPEGIVVAKGNDYRKDIYPTLKKINSAQIE
ncbi:MAG: DUF4369 domain-containing protein [Bacteroidaceae bacterium]|nr:DUF4369 domain-containing protein [Bacteroidaceae bacterium]